jgi:ABC-type Fe3+/spermidine/putrescine transport system ATPase subunit
VAAFFGNRNCISGRLRGGRVETEAGLFEVREGQEDGDVRLLVRPESVHMGEEEVNSFRALITGKQYMGTYMRYKIRMGREVWEVHGSPYGRPGYDEGETAIFTLPPEKIRLTRE